MPEIETPLIKAANEAAEFLKDVLPVAISRESVSVVTHGEEAWVYNDDEPPEPSRSLVDAAYDAAGFLQDVLPVTIRWSNIRVRMFATEGYVYLDVGMELAALRVRIGADGDSDYYTVTDNQRTPLSPVYAELSQAVAEIAIEMTDGYTEISWCRHLERSARKGEVTVVVKTETEEDVGFNMNF